MTTRPRPGCSPPLAILSLLLLMAGLLAWPALGRPVRHLPGSVGATAATKRAVCGKRIGKVEVDYGQTSCQRSDAAAHIRKSWQRKKQVGKQKTRKARVR